MDGAIFFARVESIEYLRFTGTVRYSHCSSLENHINNLFDKNDFDEVVIDLEEAVILDSTALGLLAKIAIEFRKNSEFKPVIFLRRGELANILKRVCFDQVFTIILDDKQSKIIDYTLLPNHSDNEKKMLQRVVEAHRILVELDEKNEVLFKEISLAIN